MFLSELCWFKVLETGFDVNLTGQFFKVNRALWDNLVITNVLKLCNVNFPYIYLSLKVV